MKLALFFTAGVSLQKWIDTGLFFREKVLYERHLENGLFTEIVWITYGKKDTHLAQQLIAKNQLHSKIRILSIPPITGLPGESIILSLLAPFFFHTILSTCTIMKSNQVWGAWSALLAAHLLKKKFCARAGYLPSQFARNAQRNIAFTWFAFLEKFIFFRAHAIELSSVRDVTCIASYVTKNASITLIPNFVDIDTFMCPQTARMASRILYVGRISPQKNILNLIRAMKNTSCFLDIYGSGELEPEIKKIIDTEKLPVLIYPPVPHSQLPEIYARYNWFILASHYEGTPKALLEAMACGCICIGTNVEGIREILIHQKNGIVANNCSSTELTYAILQAIQLSSHKSQEISTEAVKTIRQSYSLAAAISQEEYLYNKLSNTSTPQNRLRSNRPHAF